MCAHQPFISDIDELKSDGSGRTSPRSSSLLNCSDKFLKSSCSLVLCGYLLQIILQLASPWPSFTALACRVHSGLGSRQVVIMLLSVNRSCVEEFMKASCAGWTSPTTRDGSRTSAESWCSQIILRKRQHSQLHHLPLVPPKF